VKILATIHKDPSLATSPNMASEKNKHVRKTTSNSSIKALHCVSRNTPHH